MRELARTAGDLSYSAPGLVRLAQRITPAEHLSTLDRWIGELIATPPAKSAMSLDRDNLDELRELVPAQELIVRSLATGASFRRP